MTGGKFAAVVAFTSEFGIGNSGDLPWRPQRLFLDLAFLKYVTTHRYRIIDGNNITFDKSAARNSVIMGRKTWDSIPPKFKPMEERFNIIITRDNGLFSEKNSSNEFVHVTSSFDEAIKLSQEISPNGQVFILGGSSVYAEALKSPNCECVFTTRLLEHPPMVCDTFFPGALLKDYQKCINISKFIYEVLSPTLPKTSRVQLLENEQIKEHDNITYTIECKLANNMVCTI